MKDFIGELEGVAKPVCLLWGDQDTMAPPELLEAYRALVARKKNVELHVFPGVLHGYMMRGNEKAFDAKASAFSMARALAILQELRTQPVNA
jgi:carboxymethylenebutenolidase